MDARHGSTRYLWKDEEVVNAVRYVVYQQGETMAVYPALAHGTASPNKQSRDRQGAVP